MLVWTLGAGGLLGSAVVRAGLRSPGHSLFQASSIPWHMPSEAQAVLRREASRFASEAADQQWGIVWAAGRATVASTEAETLGELASLDALVDTIAARPPIGRGAFLLTSSAGGVYAGSDQAPFTIHTTPRPLSPYGELKLRQEQLVVKSLGGIVPIVIGRVSNVYGVGQDLTKLQGLISRLVLAAITRDTINMFVSLDTLRDYIFADDAAAEILELLADASAAETTEPRTAIIASGEATSLGYLINLVKDITRTRIPIAMGVHASAQAQSRDLRMVPSPRSAMRTPLPVGVREVYLDVLGRFQRADISLI